MTFKIGLYVRVSTEEQAENPEGSIKNQEERLKEFVKLKSLMSPFGEIREVFTDAGISAKDMKRPALQRLLRQIENKEIDLVLVTELSRFTRSIKDFSILWEFLEKHKCKFLSIKDNFDTSTAAGEMVMYMMANVAQFERKQTAERISLSFLARAKRGLYNGGTLPLGYEVDVNKAGCLSVVESEAEIVRAVFKVFLQEETLARTAKKLNTMNIEFPRMPRGGGKPRTGIFRIDMVQTILKNKSYIARRVFQTKDGLQETKAMWEPIIDDETFSKAQEMLEKNRYRKRSHLNIRYPFTLTGVCYCKTCGDRMSGKSAHGRSRKIPYYEHAWATKQQSALSRKTNKCDPHRIQAAMIEPLVWQEVKKFLNLEEVTRQMLGVAEQMRPHNDQQEHEEKLKKKSQALDLQMEALAERISRLPKNVNESIFMSQMAKLQEAKNQVDVQLVEVKNLAPQDEVIAFDDFIKFTAHFKALVEKADSALEIQNAIIRKLVHRVEITPNGFEIDFHVGKNRIKWELGNGPGSQPLLNNEASRPLAKYRREGEKKPPSFFEVGGSNTVLLGS